MKTIRVDKQPLSIKRTGPVFEINVYFCCLK
jgi:hypothetical protein